MSLLANHLDRVRHSILRKSEEMGLAKNSTLIGTAREIIISDFLLSFLPNNCSILTGEIFDCEDKRSGQTDIIILPNFAPRIVLAGANGLAFADGVISSIEIKSSISASPPGSDSELARAMTTVRKTKELKVSCTPWPWTSNKGGQIVRLSNIPVSIIAFSGPEAESLRSKLDLYAEEHGSETLPNTVTILDRGYTLVRDDEWYFNNPARHVSASKYVAKTDAGACLVDLYYYQLLCIQSWSHNSAFTPLASYLK